MGCSLEALQDVLNSVKGHPEQQETAEAIRRKVPERSRRESNRSSQEVYSIRSVPQVLGAVRKAYRHTREILVEEINGVDDNPIIFHEEGEPRVQHGANFVGQSLALAYEHLNNALTQLGNRFERQLSVLVGPDLNGGLEPMLAEEAGPNSGLAGAQLNATAILSSMRNDAQAYGSGSLTTNGGNQDVVPMTMESGRNLLEQTRRASKLLAIFGIALNQYDHKLLRNDDGGHKHNSPTLSTFNRIVPSRMKFNPSRIVYLKSLKQSSASLVLRVEPVLP